jgi:hypothetical protein
MNKTLVFGGIAVVIISKVIVLKSILVDSPEYQRCVSDGPSLYSTGLVYPVIDDTILNFTSTTCLLYVAVAVYSPATTSL